MPVMVYYVDIPKLTRGKNAITKIVILKHLKSSEVVLNIMAGFLAEC